MLSSGKHRKNRKNPNDPARFIDKTAVTDDGEIAKLLFTLDEEKIEQEAQYDGLYAVCTELFDDEPEDILTLVLPTNIGKVIKIQLCKIFKVLYGRSESFYKLF